MPRAMAAEYRGILGQPRGATSRRVRLLARETSGLSRNY